MCVCFEYMKGEFANDGRYYGVSEMMYARESQIVCVCFECMKREGVGGVGRERGGSDSYQAETETEMEEGGREGGERKMNERESEAEREG